MPQVPPEVGFGCGCVCGGALTSYTVNINNDYVDLNCFNGGDSDLNFVQDR